MHSKWKIWDFLRSRADVLSPEAPRLVAFSCFDPLAFKILRDQIPASNFDGGKLKVLLGKEVTTTWLDDNFKSLGLFGNTESYLIHFAEELSAEVKEELLEAQNLLLENRYLILNFSKEDAFYKKLVKSESCETIQIQAPAFWEDSNLLDFLGHRLQVYLGIQAKDYILSKTPFNMGSYYSLLNQIKINYPDQKNLSIDQVAALMVENKIDNFELAELFAGKKIRAFYKKLVELLKEESELISLFYFMQSHLVKVMDPSYLEGKAKLTKYDRQIKSQASIWKKEDLERAISYFGTLLLMAKKKDKFLEQRIKRDFLRTFNF